MALPSTRIHCASPISIAERTASGKLSIATPINLRRLIKHYSPFDISDQELAAQHRLKRIGRITPTEGMHQEIASPLSSCRYPLKARFERKLSGCYSDHQLSGRCRKYRLYATSNNSWFRIGRGVPCNMICQAFMIGKIAQQARAQIINRVVIIHVSNRIVWFWV